MNERTEVEKFVIQEMCDLLDFGFSGPLVTRKACTSVIDWLGGEIAIEIELDWREFEVFCLLVRLQDGHLPDGYYASNGYPCRYHLQKVIRMRRWPAGNDMMHQMSIRTKDKEAMKQNVQFYKAAISCSIQSIISEGESIFQDS